jgi:quercetin dioxygenase-like cupin family protein
MQDLTNANTLDKVQFREKILKAQDLMLDFVKEKPEEDALPSCTLTHTYTPIHEEYGCGTYARQMFIPKGTVIIGKIHRHEHLNFIMKGRVSVSTEFGPKYFEAPCVFVSEAGLKRAVYAEEDTIWVTVHTTKFTGEENLDKMEAELIAPSYDEIGLIASVEELQRIAP